MRAASTQEQRRAELREVVAAEKAIVVVGAGVSYGATGRPEALWDGLLCHGVEHCVKAVADLDPRFGDRQKEAIATGSLDEMLAVARVITRKLGDRKDSRYRNWLGEAVGSFKTEKLEVLEALRDLGRPLTTTNYDRLLEEVTKREPLTWQEPEEMLAFLRSGGPRIGHLHGLYSKPSSVVLDETSYLAVIGSEAAQAIQQGMALFHSLIFVGCGAGLQDPNFGGLLAWLREHFAGAEHRHYRLCLASEVAALEREHAGDRIAVVQYGETHDELAAFLRGLAPAKAKRARKPGKPNAVSLPATHPSEPSALAVYRAWALERFGHLEMIGVGAGELKLALSNVYVPLRLEQGPRGVEGGRFGAKGELSLVEEIGERAGRDLDLLEIFRSSPREAPFAVILGEPGAGKTTALRKLLFHVLTEGTEDLGLLAGTVPFLVRLRRLTAADLEGGAGGKRLGLGELIDRELAELAGADTFGDLGSRLWQRGQVLLLLDGLDEVADEGLRAKVCRYLQWELDGEERRGVRAVVSCRRASYDKKARLGDRFSSFDMRPLSREEGAHLVRSWYREAARLVPTHGPEAMQEKAQGLIDALASPAYAIQQIQKLVGSPLLLTLLCVVVLRGQEIPRRRTAFYAKCLEVMLHQWGKVQERAEPVLQLDAALAVLRPLAYELHREQRRDDLSKAELLLFLRERLAALGRSESPAEVLSWLVRETGVLVSVPPHDYAFAHLGLQEYLAALAIAEDAALVPALAAVAEESWWREVIELLAGLPRPQVFSRLMEALLASPVLLSDPSLLFACQAEAEEIDLEPFLDVLGTEVSAVRHAAVLRLLKGRRDARLLAHCRELEVAPGQDVDVKALAGQLLAEADRSEGESSATGRELLVLASAGDEPEAQELADRLRESGRSVRVELADGSWQGDWESLELETRAVVLVEGVAGSALWQQKEERALLGLLSGCRRVRVKLPGSKSGGLWAGPHPAPLVVDLASGLVSEAVLLLGRVLGGGAEVQAEATPSSGQVVPGSAFTEDLTGLRFLWVPSGRFRMGAEDLSEMEKPVHEVSISGFWLAETAVTNREYGVFLEQSGHKEPEYWRDKRFSSPEQPVVGVSWDEAVGFCRWLADATKLEVALPSEAQWEYASRGPEGREYPWGQEKPDARRARFGQEYRQGAPALVGSYPAGRGPFGHLDLAGNVWEWCRDSWDEGAYRRTDRQRVDPLVDEAGAERRVLRGGGWDYSAEYLRSALRLGYHARPRSADTGFRVAVSPPSR